jgi:RNA polymerase sigma factor (sigma-70 family)
VTERSRNPTSDAELAERARAGDKDAFAELWRRHAQAGRAIARSVSPTLDPDDLVAEAYGNIYALVKRGRGPTGAFRPYLAAAIRNIATSIGRSKREAAIDFADELMDETTSDDAHMRKLDRDLTTEAFRALPERWQQALWYSEVEDMSVKECAQLFGITPPAMAMLTFRAREGLRDAWIQAHITSVDPGTEHEWTVERLGAHARERLTKREALRLELHLKECESCSNIAQEARTVAARLASCLLPPLIGAGAAAAYLKEIGAGTTTASAISSGSTAGASGFSSTNALHASLHQLHVIVGSSAAISLGIASGVTLAELPAERPAEQVAGPSGTAEAASPTPPTSAKLAVAADLGGQNTFYPILSGTARPDSTVRITLPDKATIDIQVGNDGRWRTAQLATMVDGTVTVVNVVDETVVATSTLEIRLSAPTLIAEFSEDALTLTVRGIAGAGFSLTSSSEKASLSIAAAVIGPSGAWSATYAHPLPFDPADLLVRYAVGKRFGPSQPVGDPSTATPSPSPTPTQEIR